MYDYKKYAILFVDDEEKALKYFKKAFENEFRVLTALSVKEAEKIIENEDGKIGIVITDQRMPGETGVDLLGRIRRLKPNIIRMLTTAYSDLDSAIESVNSGAIFKYIVKPWDLRDLRGCLMRGMEFFLIQEERDILLREKFSMLERLIVMDRVRSLAVLVAGLGHHIRNPMTALKTFLDLIPKKLSDELSHARDLKNPEFWDDFWTLAARESEHILKIIDNVGEAVVQPSDYFSGPYGLNELISEGVSWVKDKSSMTGGSIFVDISGDMPPFLADERMLKRFFLNILRGMMTINPLGMNITLKAVEKTRVWGTEGIRIWITEDGPAWTDTQTESLFTPFSITVGNLQDPGLDLLAAFFIIHHHSGDIQVHRISPFGPGFEILLPFNPEAAQHPSMDEDYLKKIMMHSETWDEMRGGL
ncbi:MAG: response regulator [Deltaproteobacteria bacterium]|nr:response regulator [Deltaproteobacteria bacterium]